MVIPVYILPVMAVIFFTAGGVTARKRKTELEIPDKRKKISCILFLLFLVFTVLSIVILQIEGQFYGEPVKILSTALDKIQDFEQSDCPWRNNHRQLENYR